MKPLFSYDDMLEFYVILGHSFSKRQRENGVLSLVPTQTRSPPFCCPNEWAILLGNIIVSSQDKCSLVNGSSRTLLVGLVLFV